METASKSVFQLPICSTSHLSDICLTIELLGKTFHMLDIPYVQQQWYSRSQLSDSKGSPTLYPLIGLLNILAFFIYSDSWLAYKNEKLKKNPLLSVSGQSIPCKTSLRGQVQFSPYNYCNEALHYCTKHFFD